MYYNINPRAIDVPILDPELTGRHVRLEPLELRHLRGLVAASADEPDLYRMSKVPVGSGAVGRFIESAVAARESGTAAPFAVIRLADEAVIGSTRLFDLDWWPWPQGHPRHGHDGPDTCEIGHTWLTRSAIQTGANTEMKRLMLTLAFET
ncbi:MAG TPA: GNAT family N-acetyltransferase [Streptosporangiaceae bacterium]|nr:GNAT family N-acetyltransferase [Streptosporangiaceae bacterium]